MNRFIPLFILPCTLTFLLCTIKYCNPYRMTYQKDNPVPSAHIGIVVNTLYKETDIYTDKCDAIYDTAADNDTAVQSNITEADTEETIVTDTTTETVSNTTAATTTETVSDMTADTTTETVSDTATDTATTQAPATNADDTAGCIEATQLPSDICLSYPSDLIAAINAYRNSYGLAGLSEDSQLNTAAGIRCRELISSMSHTRPDGSSCSTIYAELGIYPYNWGENLAGGHYTASETATAWMDSDGHRANILNSSFTKCGVAHISCSSGYRDYWVILFTD